jgi:hypothetical protein
MEKKESLVEKKRVSSFTEGGPFVVGAPRPCHPLEDRAMHM